MDPSSNIPRLGALLRSARLGVHQSEQIIGLWKYQLALDPDGTLGGRMNSTETGGGHEERDGQSVEAKDSHVSCRTNADQEFPFHKWSL